MEIARKSVGQFNNPFYITQRRDRLTASYFGLVARRKPSTSCDILVKKILNTKSFYSDATEYGKLHEGVAISQYEELTSNAVQPCGLYIDADTGFLAASPDGYIESTNELVEVKCAYTVAEKTDLTLRQGIEQRKAHFLHIVDGEIRLNKKHIYYSQVFVYYFTP